MDTDISLDLSRLEDLCLRVIKSICMGKSTTTLSIFDELIAVSYTHLTLPTIYSV